MDLSVPNLQPLHISAVGKFEDDESRWAAVRARDPAADGTFVYCVRTTKIYCRPVCKARLAQRSNVTFYSSQSEAQKGGYRACKRCKPDLATAMPEEYAVRKIREFVAKSPDNVQLSNLKAMANQTGLSKWHFHRVFKKVVGLTPSQYAAACQTDRSRLQNLPDHWESILTLESPNGNDIALSSPEQYTSDSDWNDLFFLDEASSDSFGFDISSLSSEDLNPSFALENMAIRYALRKTSFGTLLIAFHEGKVCQMNQLNSEAEAPSSLEIKFPSLCYDHINIDDSKGPADDPVRNFITNILQILESRV